MIVFTITNQVTEQVYVGSTRTDIDSHWETLLIAAESGVEARLYDDIRSTGANNFELSEWGMAEDLKELRELVTEAKETFNAISLQGLITKPKAATAHRQSAEQRKAELALKEQNLQQNQANLSAEVATTQEELKALAKQRDAELEARIVRERHETLEMAKVLAKMDARKRSPKKTSAPKKTLCRVATPVVSKETVKDTTNKRNVTPTVQTVIKPKVIAKPLSGQEAKIEKRSEIQPDPAMIKVAASVPSKASEELKAQRIAATIDRYRPRSVKAQKDHNQAALSSALQQRLAQRFSS